MVVRFVGVIRVPLCAGVSRVCPVCVPAPPGDFLPVKTPGGAEPGARDTHGTHTQGTGTDQPLGTCDRQLRLTAGGFTFTFITQPFHTSLSRYWGFFLYFIQERVNFYTRYHHIIYHVAIMISLSPKSGGGDCV